MRPVHGLLLAAGAGRRMGTPKALVRRPDGRSWLTAAVGVLLEGGCEQVTVVLGAAADDAEQLLADGPAGLSRVRAIRAAQWQDGMGASLGAGLAALTDSDEDAALIHLVDLPDVTADVVRRVLDQGDPGPEALARASYDGRPGHPVLLGRDHWSDVRAAATGDEGARRYLAAHDPRLVECGDLATGVDIDVPAQGPTVDQRPDH